MVEFWSWLLPMVVVETRPPEPLDVTSELADSDETARLVVVAAVPVAVLKVKFCSVVLPRARSCPVVVAPPKMVRPVAVVLAPIVVEALETKPPDIKIPEDVALNESP